jgi:uncharacterized protein YbjT (DUF2867 family)
MAILVTGARGAIGRALIERLRADGRDVRAATSEPGSHDEVGVPSVHLNLADPGQDAIRALAGVTDVFLYAAPEGIGILVESMVRAGVQRVVVLSTDAVGLCDVGVNAIASRHEIVERAVAESSLITTILRPGPFTSRAFEWADQLRKGVAVERYLPDVPLHSIHPADIADVAYTALTTDTLDGQILNLCGPEPLTARDQVGVLSEILGRRIDLLEVDSATELANMRGRLDTDIASAVLDYFDAYRHGIPDDAKTSASAVGARSRTFRDWVESHIDSFA